MLEDAAIFQTLHRPSFFFFIFSGASRGISQHRGNMRILRASFWKNLYGNIFILSKTKDAKGFVTKGKFLH